jgi:hypothetical protein
MSCWNLGAGVGNDQKPLKNLDVSGDLIEGEFSSILAAQLVFLPSLDHLIRSRQHVRWDRQANFLRGFRLIMNSCLY